MNLYQRKVSTPYSGHPQALKALSLSWWFFISKFIDFFDSIFFLLRGKFSHLTLLHVLHHSTLPAFSWFGPKFAGRVETTHWSRSIKILCSDWLRS